MIFLRSLMLMEVISGLWFFEAVVGLVLAAIRSVPLCHADIRGNVSDFAVLVSVGESPFPGGLAGVVFSINNNNIA